MLSTAISAMYSSDEEAQSWFLITIAVVCLAIHIRAELTLSVSTVKSGFSQFRAFWCHRVSAQMRQMIDEDRTQRAKSFAPFLLAMFTLLITCYSIPGCMMRLPNHDCFLAFHLVGYASTLFLAFGPASKSGVTSVVTIIHIVVFVRLLGPAGCGYWRVQTFIRLIFGVIDMNYRRNTCWNLAFFFANSMKRLLLEEQLFMILVPEAIWFFFASILCLLAENWQAEQLRTSLEAALSKKALSNILSVFCDAQLSLGPTLQMLGSVEQLRKIVAGGEAVESLNFVEHLIEPDRARFNAFIDECLRAALKEDSGELLHTSASLFPFAIHVHMHDASGRAIAVKLFHTASMTCAGEPQHIIGICLDSPAPGSDALLESEPQEYVEWQDVDHVAAQPAGQAPSSDSSNSSSWQAELEELVLSIDPLSPGFPIHDCTFKFADLDEDDLITQLPKISDCLTEQEFHRLAVWTSKCVNEFAHESMVSHPCLGPIVGQAFGTEVRANSVNIGIQTKRSPVLPGPEQEHVHSEPEPRGSSSSTSAATEDCRVRVKLCLTGITGYQRLSRALRVASKRFRLPRIVE